MIGSWKSSNSTGKWIGFRLNRTRGDEFEKFPTRASGSNGAGGGKRRSDARRGGNIRWSEYLGGWLKKKIQSSSFLLERNMSQQLPEE